VMLRAAEVGEDGKRIGEVVERVEVVERTEREGEVEGEKRMEVMRVGEVERGEASEVEVCNEGGIVKGSIIRRWRSSSCSWLRRRYFSREVDWGGYVSQGEECVLIDLLTLAVSSLCGVDMVVGVASNVEIEVV